VNEELLNGERTITGTQVYETGFQIPRWLGPTSVAGSPAVPATGALAISGSTLYVYKGLGAWGGIHISGAIT
jgi:hypothetical protein